jgi:hypothetical protein
MNKEKEREKERKREKERDATISLPKCDDENCIN